MKNQASRLFFWIPAKSMRVDVQYFSHIIVWGCTSQWPTFFPGLIKDFRKSLHRLFGCHS